MCITTKKKYACTYPAKRALERPSVASAVPRCAKSGPVVLVKKRGQLQRLRVKVRKSPVWRLWRMVTALSAALWVDGGRCADARARDASRALFPRSIFHGSSVRVCAGELHSAGKLFRPPPRTAGPPPHPAARPTAPAGTAQATELRSRARARHYSGTMQT